jgi:uncharacterized protein YqgC (DUF456 family)
MAAGFAADRFWWLALLVQLLALPGTLLPLLPGLIWLPIGAGIWCLAVGWAVAWPAVVLAMAVLGLGLSADVVALTLASARLGASRWAPVGAGVGLLLGLVGLLPALPVGGPVVGALFGPWLGAAGTEAVMSLRSSQAVGWPQALQRGAVVGVAVVAGLLVSRVAQVLLALIGVLGFVVLSFR